MSAYPNFNSCPTAPPHVRFPPDLQKTIAAMRRQLSFEQLQRNGASGLIKISGDLVRVSANDTSGTVCAFASASLMLELQAADDATLPSDGKAGRVDADTLLSLDEGLFASYRGYFDCRA